MRTTIQVQGARENNLQNVDVEIPRDKLIVVTGVSGSGKSSLAFDTIYAEGQRRLLASMSTFAKRFIGQLKKPDVDFVNGLSPVVSIDQKTVGSNPRSTVGTMTDISDYLRMLFATMGTPHCPLCQEALAIRSPHQMMEHLLSLPGAAIALAYPFFKRFFFLPQAFLGVAFSFGIPMAYAAVFDRVPPIAWWLLLLNAFWVIAYDTEYAMVDRDDDVRLGLKTSAIAFGRFDIAAVLFCYAVYLAGMAAVGIALRMGVAYYAGLAVALACAMYHLWLIRHRDRERCFAAFLHNHWLGFAVFAGVALDFAVRFSAWPNSL